METFEYVSFSPLIEHNFYLKLACQYYVISTSQLKCHCTDSN